jgi:hypothetical protein
MTFQSYLCKYRISARVMFGNVITTVSPQKYQTFIYSFPHCLKLICVDNELVDNFGANELLTNIGSIETIKTIGSNCTSLP